MGMIALGVSNWVLINVLFNAELLVLRIICLLVFTLGSIAIHYSYEKCDKNKSNCD